MADRDRITLRELRHMLRADDVDEKALRPYVELDAEGSNAFSLRLRINRDLVDDEGLEGDVLLGGFNELSRKWRRFKHRAKTAFGWDGIRIVSEGDSWFQYPILLDDVIDQLSDDRHAIFSLGAAGDLLADMIDEDDS